MYCGTAEDQLSCNVRLKTDMFIMKRENGKKGESVKFSSRWKVAARKRSVLPSELSEKALH